MITGYSCSQLVELITLRPKVLKTFFDKRVSSEYIAELMFRLLYRNRCYRQLPSRGNVSSPFSGVVGYRSVGSFSLTHVSTSCSNAVILSSCTKFVTHSFVDLQHDNRLLEQLVTRLLSSSSL